jgi:aryl-alcohol dehydrogenase-like predicted oxidoreductase
MAQISSAWIAARSGVSLGSDGRQPEQLTQNTASLEMALSDEQLVPLKTPTTMSFPRSYLIFKLPRPSR